jgi:hypothetical protein
MAVGRRLGTVLLALAGAMLAARVFLRPMVNPGRPDDDLAQHVWWTERFADPALFPDDPIAEFLSGPLFAPAGYQATYRLLVPWFGALGTAMLLPFLLAVPTLVLAFLLGRRAAGGHVAGGVAGLLVGGMSLHSVAWGLPRSFALPVLLLGVWALAARRVPIWGLSLLLAALCYPPVLVNLGLLGVVVLVARTVSERRLPRGWVVGGVLAVAALAVVASVYAQPVGEGIGPKVTLEEARAMPELGRGGRSEFFVDDPWFFWFDSHRSGIGIDPLPFAVAVLVFGLVEWLLRRHGAPPPLLWAILATSFAAFFAAHATLFALHVPNRYLDGALRVAALVWAASAAGRAARALGPRLERALPVVAALGLVAIAAHATAGLVAHARKDPRHDLRAAAAFVATLPKDARVAAHPVDADLLPLWSRRSVLASRETSLPYWLGYYRRVQARLSASLAMTYASEWEDVLSIAARHGVSAFLVNDRRYERPEYPPPFHEEVERLAARGRERGFALLRPPPERVLFRRGPYAVVDVSGAR